MSSSVNASPQFSSGLNHKYLGKLGMSSQTDQTEVTFNWQALRRILIREHGVMRSVLPKPTNHMAQKQLDKLADYFHVDPSRWVRVVVRND